MERALRETLALPTFLARVVDVDSVASNVCGISLEGDFSRFNDLQGDQFAFLMVDALPGNDFVQTGYTMDDYRKASPESRPAGAYYTIREWRPHAQRLVVWVVLHGHDGSVGSWASHCAVGDGVALWGSRRSFSLSDGIEHYVLVADESGIAAVAALIDEILPGTRINVIAEVADPSDAIELPNPDNVEIDWLKRDPNRSGSASQVLDRLRILDFDGNRTVAWGAGEARQMASIRRYLRHDLAMNPAQVAITAYWRDHA